VLGEYAIPGGYYFSDVVRDGKRSEQPAFDWGVGVMLSALNASAGTLPNYRPALAKFADASLTYWDPSPPVPGFNVLPHSTSGDRYYDDNEWMVLALFDSADVLKDRRYVDWALKDLTYVLSGEDSTLGGGIYWREKGKTSKNTCSNGPAVAGCVEAYRHTKKPEYLDQAKKLYAWTKQHLQDTDGLFYDNIRLDGGLERTKWSYNTALMLRSAVQLFETTKEPAYQSDAHLMLDSSLNHWLGADGAIHDGGRFAHLLLGAWIRSYAILPKSDPLRAKIVGAVRSSLSYVHDNCRRDQYYGDRWDRPVPAGKNNLELIDQASVIRGYFDGARFLSSLH